MKSLYIIGAVTGKPNNNLEEFERVRGELEIIKEEISHYMEEIPRYRVAIPHDYILQSASWSEAMRESVLAMLNKGGMLNKPGKAFEGIAMLDDWEKSKGACLERAVADACGIECKPWREWLDDQENIARVGLIPLQASGKTARSATRTLTTI